MDLISVQVNITQGKLGMIILFMGANDAFPKLREPFLSSKGFLEQLVSRG